MSVKSLYVLGGVVCTWDRPVTERDYIPILWQKDLRPLSKVSRGRGGRAGHGTGALGAAQAWGCPQWRRVIGSEPCRFAGPQFPQDEIGGPTVLEILGDLFGDVASFSWEGVLPAHTDMRCFPRAWGRRSESVSFVNRKAGSKREPLNASFSTHQLHGSLEDKQQRR